MEGLSLYLWTTRAGNDHGINTGNIVEFIPQDSPFVKQSNCLIRKVTGERSLPHERRLPWPIRCLTG